MQINSIIVHPQPLVVHTDPYKSKCKAIIYPLQSKYIKLTEPEVAATTVPTPEAATEAICLD